MSQERGRGSDMSPGVFAAPGDPSRAPGWRARLRARLLAWGWWPEPLHEHWIIADREMLKRLDQLEDGLLTSLLTSRSVGEGKKKEIRRTHQQIKALRVYRWRQTS